MTDKEKIKLWCKGRLFELINGMGENNAKEVLKDLLDFIDADPSVESTAPNSELSNLETTEKDCKETPTNDEFKAFAQKYLKENDGEILNVYDRYAGLVDGAKWHKQQIMKEAVLCGSDGWFINNKRNCRKNGRFHKYYVSTITHDKPLPMENGKDYRLIVITED